MISAAIVLTIRSTRGTAAIAALALGLLGLLQFGFARAVSAIGEHGPNIWFDLSLAFGIPVSLTWLLLSLTLGRTSGTAVGRPWRAYVIAQSLFAIYATSRIVLRWGIAPSGPEGSFAMDATGKWVLIAILCNLIVLVANFESTHLALSPRARRIFRPALLGMYLCTCYFVYVLASSVIFGRVAVSDLSLGVFPIVALAAIVPVALAQRRMAAIQVRPMGGPLVGTVTVLVAAGALLAIFLVVRISAAAGWSMARALWALFGIVVALLLVALSVSNRLRRRFQQTLDPLLFRSAGADLERCRDVAGDLVTATTLEEFASTAPCAVRVAAGVEPVTLFLVEADRQVYRASGSTLLRVPSIELREEDALVRMIRRASRGIALRSRPDDLEMIPVYVESGSVLAECGATWAVPLWGEQDFLGFLLCGDPESGQPPTPAGQAILNAAALIVANQLETIRLHGKGRRTLPGEQAPAGSP